MRAILRRAGIPAAVLAVIAAITALAFVWGSNSPVPTSSPQAQATTTTASTTSSSSTTVPVTAATTTTSTVAIEPVGVPDEPAPEPEPPEAGSAEGFTGTGIVTVAAGGADLSDSPDGTPFVRAREGLVFVAESLEGDMIRLFTTCDSTAYVHESEVYAEPGADGPHDVGAGFDMEDAVVVIDPGHGGPNNIGAVGPGDLAEKVVNLDISRRVRDLLSTSHVVDWGTGRIYTGSKIPAAGRVILTRNGAVEAGDYEAGLEFRAALANASGADVMVSIHNNAGWEIDLEHPGSDVYYQSQQPYEAQSRRLARLLGYELQVSFGQFDAAWVGARFVGAKSRLSPRDGESQYYGVLRRAELPSVIAEGAYLGNPTEADLLRTARFRQAYAEAVYRALVRFLTTDDAGGAPSLDPEIWYGNAGSGDARPSCEIPNQPEPQGD